MQRNKSQVTVHYVASTTFTIDKGYTDLKPIGRGSYGVVCSAFSTKLNRKVAIKKITPISKHTSDAKHVLREIMLMRHMGKHENVITMEDLILRESNDELYIVMELLDSDLHRVLQSKQTLTESHYKYFLFQLLCGLKYLHDNKIIHRDLKPGNLLVSKDCKLRITDFGLARERPDNIEDGPMTEHVVTRWYRSPELMLCPDGLYSFPVDVWSCGCILAEMLGRNPLFPGKTFIHQLSLCFDVIGTPQDSDVQHIVNSEAREFLQTQRNKRKVAFSTLYPTAESSAWRLLDQFLQFNPDKRITVDDALQSPYLRGVGQPISLYFPPVSPDFAFPFENPNITRHELKKLIAAEVISFRREKFPPSVSSKHGTVKGSTGVVDSDNEGVNHDIKEPAVAPNYRMKPTNTVNSAIPAVNGTAAGTASNQVGQEHTATRHPSRSRAQPKHDTAIPDAQHKDEKSETNDPNIPSYLKGTRNFKMRSASAPKGRHISDANKPKMSSLRREDKHHAEDDVSVNSRHHRTGIALRSGMDELAPNGDVSPRLAHDHRKHTHRANSDSKGGPSEVTSSTMRNLLDMCDEMYRDEPPAANKSSAAQRPSTTAQPTFQAEAKMDSPARAVSSRAVPITRYQATDSEAAECKTIDRHENLRDSKDWAASLYHTTTSAAGQRSPSRTMRVASQRDYATNNDEESDHKASSYHTTRNSYSESKHSDGNEPRSAHARSKPSTLQENEALLAQMQLHDGAGQANAHTSATHSTHRRYMENAAASDTEDTEDEEDLLTPVQRSPPRKSLLETYTSPKRLGNRQGELDPTSPNKGFPQRTTAGAEASYTVASPDRHRAGGSLVDKLHDRAHRLAASYEYQAPPEPHAPPVHPQSQSFVRPATAARQEYSDVEDDSSAGTAAPRVYPTEEDEEEKERTKYMHKDKIDQYAAPSARLHSTLPAGGIAARERDHRPVVNEREAPPIIPPPMDKKKYTVGKSPKFALMSWQKRLLEQKEAEEKEKQRLDEEAAQKKKSKATKANTTTNDNYFGYQAPKRSDSAPRRR